MRAEPLTPERLLELERLQDAYRDVSARFDDALRTQSAPDVMLTVEVGGAYRALREALFDAGPELLRVYRGASGDSGLAARMHRETRIITLEQELAKARFTRNAAFEDEVAFLCDLCTALELPFETAQRSDVFAAIKRLRGVKDE